MTRKTPPEATKRAAWPAGHAARRTYHAAHTVLSVMSKHELFDMTPEEVHVYALAIAQAATEPALHDQDQLAAYLQDTVVHHWDYRAQRKATRIVDLPGLSLGALDFVQEYPRAAEIIAVTALEEAAEWESATGDKSRKRPRRADPSKRIEQAVRRRGLAKEGIHDEDTVAALAAGVPARLARFAVREPDGPEMLGVTEVTERLEVTRQTVYNWLRKGMLIGWKTTKQGHVIPAEQIVGPGRIVEGIPEVLAIIEDPELAWEFLSEEWPFADDVARPIDKLKAGETGDVLAAAPSFGTAVT